MPIPAVLLSAVARFGVYATDVVVYIPPLTGGRRYRVLGGTDGDVGLPRRRRRGGFKRSFRYVNQPPLCFRVRQRSIVRIVLAHANNASEELLIIVPNGGKGLVAHHAHDAKAIEGNHPMEFVPH